MILYIELLFNIFFLIHLFFFPEKVTEPKYARIFEFGELGRIRVFQKGHFETEL